MKARLLEAHGEMAHAGELFKRSADISLAEGLLVVAGMSLAGLARVQYLHGRWDDAVVSAERAMAVAIESEDRWVIAHAQWSAAFVASARGDRESAERCSEVAAEPATFERHAALQHLFGAQLAAAQERPADVLAHLAPLAALHADFTVLPWQHLQAHALVDVGRLDAAEAFIDEADALAAARRDPLSPPASHARARLAVARHTPEAAIDRSSARVRRCRRRMPYERALIELAHAQLLRREGKRRAASELLLDVRETFAALAALPALRRAEQELTACGLRPSTRSAGLRAAHAAGDRGHPSRRLRHDQP